MYILWTKWQINSYSTWTWINSPWHLSTIDFPNKFFQPPKPKIPTINTNKTTFQLYQPTLATDKEISTSQRWTALTGDSDQNPVQQLQSTTPTCESDQQFQPMTQPKNSNQKWQPRTPTKSGNQELQSTTLNNNSYQKPQPTPQTNNSNQ